MILGIRRFRNAAGEIVRRCLEEMTKDREGREVEVVLGDGVCVEIGFVLAV